MKPKFKVGDRVKLTRSSHGIPCGYTDVISAIHGNEVKLTAPDYIVELDALVLVEGKTDPAKLPLINTNRLLTSIKLD